MSLNMGRLTPTLVLECVPGDNFRIGCDTLVRFAPMIAPVMHRANAMMHYFFVPYRLLWDGWEDFYAGNTFNAAGSNTPPAFPTITLTTELFGTNSGLSAYLGLPDPIDGSYNPIVSAMPFAAYQKIWNDFYRDQNLQLSMVSDDQDPDAYACLPLVDGDNPSTPNEGLFKYHYRAWMHDYFTGSLPWAQKGEPVQLPIGTPEDVPVLRRMDDGDQPVFPWDNDGIIDTEKAQVTNVTDTTPSGVVDPEFLFAQTSNLNIDSTTINDLRTAIKVQEWYELMARGGTRYTEQILSQFGVRSKDSRLQRPEFIYGTKTPLVFSEVLNTTGASGGLPQGNMAGHGAAFVQGDHDSYYCEEFGLIIGLVSVLPVTAYQQGIPKSWLKITDASEYLTPMYDGLGEQPVLNAELFAHQAAALDTFGYVPRYSEYRFMFNRVAGQFRDTLSFWHMGRIFDDAPVLDESFITADPTFRIFAVTDESVDHVYLQIVHKITVSRLLAAYGVPDFS